MKVITKKINVYEFKELSETAKIKVINNYINFILEFKSYEDMTENMRKAIDKAEDMQTPWFTGSYIYDFCLDDILENVNNYYYLSNGNIYIDN